MPSTYTLNNGIELIATGEQSGTWGDTTNTNMSLLDTALDGQVTVTLASAGTSGSPNTLPISDGAASDGRNRLVIFNDGADLGATAYVQLTPNDAEKIVYIRNALSGSRSIIVFQGTYNASNDYEIPAGTTAVVYFNGGGTGAVAANVFNNAHFDALNIVGAAAVGTTLTVGTSLNIASSTTVDGVLDEDNMASDSATKLATQQSIKAYVDSQVTAQDLDFAGDSGTGAVDLDSQTFTISGTANEIETSASGQTLTVGLPDNVTIAGDLTVDTNTLFVDSSTNKVSIGTTSSDGTLHVHTGSAGVVTAAAAASNLVIENSGAVGLSLLFDDTNTNSYGVIYWGNETDGNADGRIEYFGSTYVNAADRQAMLFRAAAVERLRLQGTAVVINETGADTDFRVESDTNTHALFVDAGNNRVGVLTSSPVMTLDVDGQVAIGKSGNNDIGSETDIALYGNSIISSVNSLNLGVQSSGYMAFYTGLTSNTGGTAGGTERVRLTSDGALNVNNSDITGASNALFNVANSASSLWSAINTGANAYSAMPSEIAVMNTQDDTADSFGGIFFQGGETTAGSAINAARIGGIREGTGSANTALGFAVRGASGMLEAMRINSSYYVGINEAAPDYQLHVNSGTTNVVAKFESTDSTSVIQFVDNNGNSEFGTSGSTARISPNGSYAVLEASQSSVVINNAAQDTDFRVESNTETHAIFVDAGNDRVGLFSSSPTSGYKVSFGGGAFNVIDDDAINRITSTAGYSVETGGTGNQFRICNVAGHGARGRIRAVGSIGYGDPMQREYIIEVGIGNASEEFGVNVYQMGDPFGHNTFKQSNAEFRVYTDRINSAAFDVWIELGHFTRLDFFLEDVTGITGYFDNSGTSTLPATAVETNTKSELLVFAEQVRIGTQNSAQTSSFENMRAESNQVIFNENSADIDFRVESDSNTNMLMVNAGGNRVGIGRDPTLEVLEVAGNIRLEASNAEINLKSGITGTTGGVNWTFNTDSTNFASIKLDYDSRATTGLHVDSGYPITLDYSASGDDGLAISSSGVLHNRFNSSGATFNEGSSANLDFRVESDTSTHALFVDAGSNHVNINTSVDSGGQLNVAGDIFNDLGNSKYFRRGTYIDPRGVSDGVYGGYLLLVPYNSGAAAVGAAMEGTFIASRGNSGTGNSPARCQVWCSGTYTNTVAWFKREGATQFFQSLVRVTYSGTEYVALKFAQTNGGPVNGIYFDGWSLRADSNFLFMARDTEITGSETAFDKPFPYHYIETDVNQQFNYGVTFNDAGGDHDFRVESDNNTHALFVDAGEDTVSIGTSSPPSDTGVASPTLNVSGSAQISSGYYTTFGNPNGRVFTLNTAGNGASAFIKLEGADHVGYRSEYMRCTNASGIWTITVFNSVTSGTAPTFTIANNSTANPTITLGFNTAYSGGYCIVNLGSPAYFTIS